MTEHFSRASRTRASRAAAIAATFLFIASGFARGGETIDETLAKCLTVRAQLAAELQQLDDEHASDTVERWRDVVRAWHERNAARLEAQAQRAAKLRKAIDASAPPPARLPPIPPDSSAEVREFLTEARWAEAELQVVVARWKDVAPEQRRDAVRAWHEQHARRLAAQKERAEIIREQVEAHLAAQPLITLIPSDASPQLREMLTLQADLDDELAAVTDALKDASPERIRDAARDWHDRHRAEFERLAALREKLTNAPPPER